MSNEIIDISIDIKAEHSTELFEEVKNRYGLIVDGSNINMMSHYLDDDKEPHLTFNAVIISKDDYEDLKDSKKALGIVTEAIDKISGDIG